MKAQRLISTLSLSLFACSGAMPPPPAEPEPSPAAPPQEEATYAEPSAEELAQEEALERLEEERAQMRGQAQIELRRFTPQMREQAKTLVSQQYPDLKAAVTAALSSPHRRPDHPERDAARHPLETLSFFGITPQMHVLEYGPGEGWYTEILAPALAGQGKLLVTTTDPNGPKESRSTFYAERLKLFLAKSEELYGKVEPVIVSADAPELGIDGKLDAALVIRGMHGWVRSNTVDNWLKEIHTALKPQGILGIVQHRSHPGADPKVSAEKGYLPEAWVVERVEAHGFTLAEKSEINQNEKDTKDHPEGVWTLPPNLRLGEKDREKYTKIGESDRMTLRFMKNK